MAARIQIRETTGTWVVRAGGAILGESNSAIALQEGSYEDVIYFPRDDLAMAFLEPSEKDSHCPHKGDARYFSIVTKSTTLNDVAWSYEAPFDQAAAIKDFIAFHPSDTVVVEEV